MKNITFKDFFGMSHISWNSGDDVLTPHTVSNVDHPVLIDQCYSTAADVCAQFPSKLTISDVHCAFRSH